MYTADNKTNTLAFTDIKIIHVYRKFSSSSSSSGGTPTTWACFPDLSPRWTILPLLVGSHR